MRNRVLSYLNYLAGLVLVGAIFAGYWYVYRPQAQTSGSEEAGVAKEVTIARDERGVPHITAQSMDDLFFAQGYVHAQDRLFQLDLTRRQAAGELAEIFGANSLASDLDARRLGLVRMARAQAAALKGPEREAIAAYARGINHFIETHTGQLPLEFTVLRYAPAPWTVADSLLVALNMTRALNDSWRYEIAKQSLIAAAPNPAEKQLVEYLYPARSGAEPQMGSNAWVVSGSRTTTGKPILANDPHLGLSLPVIWYANDLRAPGFHVAGVSLPGLPAVIVGHNDSIAWGVTNAQFDVQDLYLERADLSQGVVAFEGRIEPMGRGSEGVRIKGGAVATENVFATRHGPVITQSAGMASPFQLALRWEAYEPGALSVPLIDLNRAGNWEEFRAALRQWGAPAQNFLYADTAGNIGYQLAGRLPKRPNHTGDVPVDGGSGQYEWDGVIPFEELPSAYNPASGVLASANQNPFPADYPYRVNGNFAPPDRVNQILARLQAQPKVDAAYLSRLQTDVYSAFHRFLAQQLARAAEPRAASDDRLRQTVDLLKDFNGQMRVDSAAGMIVDLAWQNLRRAIVSRISPNLAATYDYPMGSAAAERLLRERPKEWFTDYDQLLVRALLDGLTLGEREQGNNLASWRLGRHQELTLSSPVLGSIRALQSGFRGWLQIGREELPGAPTTVRQRTQRGAQIIAPSMRFIADLGDLSRSTLTLVTGQSGQAFSSHYMDQWPAYRDGVALPFPGTAPEEADVLTLRPAN